MLLLPHALHIIEKYLGKLHPRGKSDSDNCLNPSATNSMPRWTYGIRITKKAPFVKIGKADPINVIVEGYSFRSFSENMEKSGWIRCPLWKIHKANINFISPRNTILPQKCSFFLPYGIKSRYHLRAWDYEGKIIGQAHIDNDFPHIALNYDMAEMKVVDSLNASICKKIFLDNMEKGVNGNDGWAMLIFNENNYNESCTCDTGV